MTKRFTEKTVVVTGGTTGIGLEIARRFLEEGARVACASRNKHQFDSLYQDFHKFVKFYPVDVTCSSEVESMFQNLDEHWSGVDILVANSGIYRDKRLLEIDNSDFIEVFNVNVVGVLNCVKSAMRRMRNKGNSSIIAISSIMSFKPANGAGAYAVSKSALESLIKTLVQELGNSGPRINAIAPGFVDTGMGERVSSVPRLWDRYSSSLLMKRMGSPREIANSVLFLAGSESSYIHGQVLEVSGGLVNWPT